MNKRRSAPGLFKPGALWYNTDIRCGGTGMRQETG